MTEAVLHFHPAGRIAALVGNPNAGKTALFNRLTGSNQKVANYAGVTIRAQGGPPAAGVWQDHPHPRPAGHLQPASPLAGRADHLRRPARARTRREAPGPGGLRAGRH
jgi:ferrous iron transport protein B